MLIEKLIRERDEDTYGDDDFLDRTKKKIKLDPTEEKKILAKMNTTENFNSLKTRLEKLLELRQELNSKIMNIAWGNENANEIPEKKEDETDELDKFMMQNETSLKSQSRDKLLKELKDINDQINE